MNAIAIVLIGMAVVVVSILALRLHAFLALVLGALVVACLTPGEAVRNQELRGELLEVSARDVGGPPDHVGISVLEVHLDSRNPSVSRLSVLDAETLRFLGFAVNRSVPGDPLVGMTSVVTAKGETRAIGFNDVFVHPDTLQAAESLAAKPAIAHVATGFGNTAIKIGILIAMAAIIGTCLLRSGAAERIVTSALDWVGEKRAGVAFTASGFTLAIPVFFDTVFYLLIPLGKALRRKTGRNYTLYIMAIVLGGTMAHSLVPPTPGPLLVAAELGVDLGAMMIGGLMLGVATVVVGYQYARWANNRWDIPLRDEEEQSEPEESNADSQRDSDDHVATANENTNLPPLWLALLPILLPVLLIGGGTATKLAVKKAVEPTAFLEGLNATFAALGDKNIALIIGAAIAMLTLVIYKRASRKELAEAVQKSLMAGGVIILITSAGGAFGHVLRQTDIAAEMQRFGQIDQLGIALLPLAFLITTIVRTAQGSATVAMITAVGIIGPIVTPMVADGTLPFHPVYIALAIGCGSKPISWMNDSGFWVIGRMSGMTEAETLKTSSMVMIVMAITGLVLLTAAAMVLPLA